MAQTHRDTLRHRVELVRTETHENTRDNDDQEELPAVGADLFKLTFLDGGHGQADEERRGVVGSLPNEQDDAVPEETPALSVSVLNDPLEALPLLIFLLLLLCDFFRR